MTKADDYYYKGKYDKAIREYSKDVNQDLYNFRVGTCYYKKGDYEKALVYYKDELTFGNDYSTLFNMSLCYRYLGEVGIAIIYMNKAYTVAPPGEIECVEKSLEVLIRNREESFND